VERRFGDAIALVAGAYFFVVQVAHGSRWATPDCGGTCECGVVGPKHRLHLGVDLIGLGGHVGCMIGLMMMCGAAGHRVCGRMHG
jgi:hypothetical protein